MNDAKPDPCPFCGYSKTYYGTGSAGFGTVIVCNQCGARGPCHSSVSQADAAWNFRAAPAVPGRLAEAEALLGTRTPASTGKAGEG